MVLCLVIAPTSALASPPAPQPSEQELTEARALFGEGLTLVEQERWQEAADRFEQVLRVKASAVVAYNLASALVKLERYVQAAELLRGLIGDPEAAAEARNGAAQLLSEVEPHIGTVSIRLQGPDEDVMLHLDGRELAADDGERPIEVDPGAHAIVAERDGEEVATATVHVGGTHPRSVVVQLSIAPRAPTPAEVAASAPRAPVVTAPVQPAPDDSEIYERWWFWAGAGAVVATSVMTALVLSGGSDAVDPVRGDIEPALLVGRVVRNR